MDQKPFGNRPMTLDEFNFILSTTHGEWKVFVGDNTRVVFNLRCKANYIYLGTTDSIDDGLTVSGLRELVDQEYTTMHTNPDGITEKDFDLREVYADPSATTAIVDVAVNRNEKSITLLIKSV